MGTEITPDVLRGFLEPDTRMEWWAEESGQYEAGAYLAPLPSGGPLAGVPEPQQDTAMVLRSGGTQSANKALRILTQTGGFQDRGGATFLWYYDGFEDEPYGYDGPNLLAAWEPLDWTSSSTDAYRFPDAVTLDDGTVLAVSATGMSTVGILAWVRHAVTTAWTSVAVYAIGTQTQEAHPALCVLPSGRVLAYFWVNDEAEHLASVRMMYSDDKGASWSLGSTGVLPETWPTEAGATGYDTRRLRAAYKDGQVMLVAWLTSHDTGNDTQDFLVQYASSDLGQRFAEVARHDTTLTGADQEGGAFPCLRVAGGYFMLAYLDLMTGCPRVVKLASAYEDFTAPEAVDATTGTEVWGTITGGGSYFSDGDLCMWVDEAENVYLSGRQPTVGNAWIVIRSADYGATWAGLGRSSMTGGVGKWWDSGVDTTYPADACATWHRGRALIVHSHESSPGVYQESLSVSYLGGSTSVTMPTFAAERDLGKQVTWGQTWLPFDEPDALPDWSKATVGSTSAALTGGLLVTTAGVGGELTYTLDLETLDEIAVAGVTVAATSGTVGIRLIMTNGVTGHAVLVKVTTTEVQVYDDSTAALIDSWTYDGDEVQVLIGQEGNAVTVWARVYDTGTARGWTKVAQEPGLDDDGYANNKLDLITYASSEGAWRLVGVATDEGTSTAYAGVGIYNQGPEDLFGRPYASQPVYVDDGVTVAAVDGPTFRGDVWAIDTRYTYDPGNLLPHLEPSRRKVWRSAPISELDSATDAIRLAWRIDTDGAGDYLDEDTRMENGLWGLFIDGRNFPGGTISVYYGGAWVEVDQLVTHSFQGRRYGNTVRPYSETSGVIWRQDEAAGAFISCTNVATVQWTGIVETNAEGATYQTALTPERTAVFRLAEADASHSTASRTYGIAPRRYLMILHPASFSHAIQGIRIEIPVPAAATVPGRPSEGYYEMGVFAFGSVHVLGSQYGWDRAIQTDPNVEITRAPDGTRRTKVLGPALQTVEVNWADGVDMTSQRAAAPDYVTAADTAGAEPVAFRYDTPEKLEDLARRWGSDRVIVYLPSVARDEEGVGWSVDYLQRARGAVYGRITSPVRLEQVLGEELSTDLYRVTTVEITEEP